MRLPRDVGGMDLAKKLQRFGYQVTRQTGSHVRLTTQQNGEHHASDRTVKPNRNQQSAFSGQQIRTHNPTSEVRND